MPGVKVFTDVSLNFNKMDYIDTLPEAWKDEGCFVAAISCISVLMFWRCGSFFLPGLHP
jgi:hypothetical protein